MEGGDPLKCGRLLGDLTCELAEYAVPGHPEPFIKTFASSGPKSYSYQVEIPGSDKVPEIRKMKGITLNYNNREIMGMAALQKMIRGEVAQYDVEQLYRIGRNNMFEVYTEFGKTKKVRLVFSKRRRVGVDRSLPFGTVDGAVEQHRPIPKDEFDVRNWSKQ